MNEPKFRIVVIIGDGIGVDVTDATLAVIDAARDRDSDMGTTAVFNEITGKIQQV